MLDFMAYRDKVRACWLGKNNLRFGLQPLLSGWYGNHNKDSCGIREYTFEITPQSLERGRYDLSLQIRSRGRANLVLLSIPLLVD